MPKKKEKSKFQEKPKEKATIRRRELLKAGLLSGSAAILTSKRVSARAQEQESCSPCPTLEPFVDALPIMPVAQRVRALNPGPTLSANITGGEANRDDHQRFSEFPPTVFYDINISEGSHKFHRDLPSSQIWGHSNNRSPAITPGPTFMVRYGESVIVRRHNNLPIDHVGFGSPEVTTHLHNGHTPSESDGNADNFFGSGLFKDYHYPNIYAGHDTFTNIDPVTGLRGDKREALSTLWYHDHRVMFTAPNVYKGMAGFYFLFDAIDSGNENDRNPNALRLPSGAFDVPLIFQDKAFDECCNLLFDQIAGNPTGNANELGFVGDKFAVNGKIQPFFRVARRKYRFRLLNGGPSRWYQFYLDPAPPNAPVVDGVPLPFTQISSDGNLLPGPVPREFIQIGVAERIDVIIDFSQYKIGDSVHLVNRLKQTNGTGPDWVRNVGAPGEFVLDPLDTATRIMRFDVVRDATDNSRVPNTLRELPDLPPLPTDLSTIKTIISFTKLGPINPDLDDSNPWTVRISPPCTDANGQPIATDLCPNIGDRLYEFPSVPLITQPQGSFVVWELQNGAGGNPTGAPWSHPIHIHFEEFRILERLIGIPQSADTNVVDFISVPLPPEDQGRKDVIRLPPLHRVRIVLRLRDWMGKYLLHCHNTVHEDHAMMFRWDIVP